MIFLTSAKKDFNKYLDLVEKILFTSPVDLIYNIDETGFSDWEDKKSKDATIPRELLNTGFQYLIDRSNKHITLVVTISADDGAYFPLTIYHQNKKKKKEIQPIIKMQTGQN